ncbi:Flp pilus assembly protein CpaB [Alcaligenes faecalis]|uniref:Flp pilus assembly protein CpaB n=1 Tax=Alcaligenes faecalis TaxID=511 RepID=UPI000A2D2DF0|nr:Flp pilus assembly protein CpaB [Alcaligenes faecalis]OSZ41636.1 Flp pilus assembly protein CpaB [Alcaligenes faecalis]OSZ48473.1 Flp pilus assembly protein CpaB [Alcaligenes faecalis]OSZ50202.1 Flp pilus assembly protein CpaB [Alcaligenes faecalis]
MSGIMKGAAVLLLLIAAVLVAFALYLGMKPKPEVVQPVVSTQSTEPAATLQAVVLVKRDMKAGETLQADALELAQWPAAPAQSFNTLEALTGKTLRFDLGQGQPVLSSFIAKSLASYLEDGERAVTIPIDVITGASHRVEPGDLVDIFITFNSGNEVNDTQARLLMPRVRVLAYGGASLSGPDPAEASATNRAETQARHAMLAVPVESVNELLLASRGGSLQLVLRAPKDENLPDASLFPEFAGLIPARAGLDADQRDALKLPENRAMAGLGLREFAISQTEKEQVQARAKASGEPYVAPPRRTEVIRGGRLEVIQY